MGVVISAGFYLLATDMRESFDKPGFVLFLGGWTLIIGSSSSSLIDKLSDDRQPTRPQKWVERLSVWFGGTLTVVACTFFLNP